MYIRIHHSKEYTHGNSDSCAALATYLEKENEIEGTELSDRRLFFDQRSDQVSAHTVINKIDHNVAKLSKKEARYYMISINPSQDEQRHIVRLITGRNVSSLSDMTQDEQKKFEKSLQDYSRKVMDEYAAGFNKGLTGDDIMYFGKIEHERKYSRLSDEVQSRERFAGELKEGLQSHVHIIVSRKDMSNTIRLSPFANHKNSKNILNGKQVQVGFNRKEFVQRGEMVFDSTFGYQRNIKQSFTYRHSMKRDMATLANSYINQVTGGVYMNMLSAIRMSETMKEDPLKALSGLMYKNEVYRNAMKMAQMAAKPQKIILEVAKKLPSAIGKAATLKI